MSRETRAQTLARCLPVDGGWVPDSLDIYACFVAARGYSRASAKSGGYHYYSGVDGAAEAGLVEVRGRGLRSFEMSLTDKGRALVAGGGR